jgi:hypothetical protein
MWCRHVVPRPNFLQYLIDLGVSIRWSIRSDYMAESAIFNTSRPPGVLVHSFPLVRVSPSLPAMMDIDASLGDYIVVNLLKTFRYMDYG